VWYYPGVTPEGNIFVAEFRKNTGQNDVGKWELWRDDS